LQTKLELALCSCVARARADIIVKGLTADVDRLQLYELFAPFGGAWIYGPADSRTALCSCSCSSLSYCARA